MSRERYKNIAGSCVFFAVGIVLWVQTQDYSALGSVFPRTMALLTMVISALLFLRTLLKSPTQETEADTEETPDVLRGIALVAVMIIWLVLMKPLGFLLSSFLAFASLVVISERETVTIKRMAFIMICGCLLIWGVTLVMSEVMMVPIPKATLF